MDDDDVSALIQALSTEEQHLLCLLNLLHSLNSLNLLNLLHSLNLLYLLKMLENFDAVLPHSAFDDNTACQTRRPKRMTENKLQALDLPMCMFGSFRCLDEDLGSFCRSHFSH